MFTFTGKSVLITGANRGIGAALVEAALARGAGRVWAGTRQAYTHPDPKVTPLVLDVTDATQARLAAERVGALDVLVNNAGLAVYGEMGDRDALERQLAVNLFGPFELTQAFLPALTRAGGAVVNVLSIAAWAAIPVAAGYSISKAAAFSLSQSLRAELAGRGVSVHAAMLGPVDTDMTKELQIPKASPESVAANILDGVAAGDEEIFPDPLAQLLAEGWRTGAAKAMERQNAALVATPAGR